MTFNAGSSDPADQSGGRSLPLSMVQDQDGNSALFRSLPVAVMVTDASTGRVLEINDSCLDLFGISRDAVMGKTLNEAGLSFVVDLGRQGRALKSAEATLVDAAGAQVTCSLYTASSSIAGVRTVISVLLDNQMEKAMRGGRRVAPAPGRPTPAGPVKPLAILVTPGGPGDSSTGEMLQLLGFEVLAESTPKLALSMAPLGRPAGLVVIDSPRDQAEADACLSEIVRACPGCRAVVISDPGVEILGNAAVLYKPVSINDLADSAR